MALAGELSPALPRPVHERAALRSTAGSLWSQLPSPPLPSASPPTAGSRLQTSPLSSTSPDFCAASSDLTARLPDLSRLSARMLRAPLYRVREAKFELRSLTPRWLRPLGCFDPIFGRRLHRADVVEITDPARRGKLWFCLGSTAVRCGLAVAGAKWRRET